MTLDQLETLISVAEEGGLRAASKVLHKTQPTLSTGIKNLEQELKITLLNRDGYRVSLTEAGEVLYQKARDILEHVNQFQLLAREMSMGREPKLNLAIDYLCPLDFLLNILHTFKKKCEHTQIMLDFEVLSGCENKVINEYANLAITPFIQQHSELETQKICEIKVIPVAAKSLFKSSRPQYDTFIQAPQIIVKDSTKNNSQPIDFGQNRDSKAWIVSDHMIKRELIINGFGWGHLEESSILEKLKANELTEIKTKNVSTKRLPLYLIRGKNHPFGPAAQDLCNYVLTQFENFKQKKGEI
jgi:DNA-binding transcriptional LysR family regulator